MNQLASTLAAKQYLLTMYVHTWNHQSIRQIDLCLQWMMLLY